MKANTYDTQTAKFAASILTCMPEIPSDIMQSWIENPKGLQHALTGALCLPKEQKTSTSTFKTFRMLKLGTGIKTADDFRKALKKANCEIGSWGDDILGKPAFKAADTETEVELVMVSNAELGFENGATVKETYARAKELGLELCPNEVGPQLRLQYKDQPKGEWLLIAMEPITGSDGDLGVFSVERDDGGGQWLRGRSGHPDCRWDAGTRWVFLRRK